jgi:hypothetical protein
LRVEMGFWHRGILRTKLFLQTPGILEEIV